MKKNRSRSPIPALSLEAQLKRRIRSHLSDLGFVRDENGLLSPPTVEKSTVRQLHSHQRAAKLHSSKKLIERGKSEFEASLASGTEIDPGRIQLSLVPVRSETLESRLFRMASLTWSVPVSNGFGRRMRYLVWDKHHNKLAGIVAIGDPVFNLNVRDRHIGWDAQARSNRLCNVLDAYVLGALPPYNMLLVGKAIACLLTSREVYDDFREKYDNKTGLISGLQKDARLLAVTTTSSMGRSSVYNRLNLAGQKYLEPIGFTKGWGHFHIPDDLFDDLRKFLQAIGHPYADQHSFGQGPNWRLRTIRASFSALDLQQNLLHHGIKRQVFISFLAKNAKELLCSAGGEPDIEDLLTVSEINGLAKDRWILPRSARNQEFRTWRRSDTLQLIDQIPSSECLSRVSK